MQEGDSLLMQMAKTSAALKRHSDAGFVCECADGTRRRRRDSKLGDAGGYYSGGAHALIGFCGAEGY